MERSDRFNNLVFPSVFMRFGIGFLLTILVLGCLQQKPSENATNMTNNTTVPSGYEVKDYCENDSDCVRVNKCCDCGLGEYVNRYNQQPECPKDQPRCLCATALSHGECQNNKCAAVPDKQTQSKPQPAGFCGFSTNDSCETDTDCIKGGCSGQVCQSRSEEPLITTCEYRECYDAETFEVNCGCISGQCKWN